jgi:hypothetical protein
MSTANTNLKRHFRKHHRELWYINALKNGWKNLDLQVSTQSAALQGRLREAFDVEIFHQCLVGFIVTDDQVCRFCTSNCINFSPLYCPGN